MIVFFPAEADPYFYIVISNKKMVGITGSTAGGTGAAALLAKNAAKNIFLMTFAGVFEVISTDPSFLFIFPPFFY